MNSFLKKSLVATLIAGVLIPSAFSQVKKERETEEQKAARKARMYKKLGGHVINKGTMKGKFIFINTQTAIPEEPLRETAKSMADFLMSDFSLQHSDTPVSFVDAAKTIKASGATAGVVIGKDAAMPALTIVPDSLCAYINVTPLEGDAKLSPRRVRLEMWRALGYLYGIDFEGCMLHPVKTIDELKGRGLWFACADMGGDEMYKCNLTGAIGLVIGNEGSGVSRLVKEKCDYIVSIPMRGDIESLNASVATGILAYEIVRQRSYHND